ncbi:MAM and LDL-receptor class A domain-containing protein 2 isoform X2 [Mugil cephalus]|uniref:MAM and LDL-receptor class A domain-containing protein 2 isoform X2 n=1 Tax=Mugil cephalus TaxID=48193 RepID=UPI001FB60CF3|nr:MAM and LDL-receptor class A domain-containing protein 2 isoform X2 [Mugil cephalus]
MKHLFILLSVLFVIVSSCPDGEFKCKSGGCLPTRLVCDFKSDCADGSDEEFCGSCNFDHHSCGWKNASDSTYSWRRQMANITLIPGQDHTTGSPWGHVMHVDANHSARLFERAKLEYSVDHLAALGCQISFWYHIHEFSPSYSASLELTLVRGQDVKKILQISKSKTDVWENATAFIGNQPGGYKLLFTFNPPFMVNKDVMLDDINFEYCAENDVPAGSENLSCDFEMDTCSWYRDYTTSLLWKRTKGSFKDLSGYYMAITASHHLDTASTARLVSYPQPAGQVICVSFMYHIFGNSIGSLKFIVKRSGEPETVAWMRSGTQGNKWRFADLTFNSDKPIQFIVEAVVGGVQGTIAIDDIVVSNSGSGSCPPERECTFQGSLCGLLPQPSAAFSWDRINGTSQPANSSGPVTDHTLGTEQGYYLSAQLWKHPVGTRGAVMTAVMEATPPDGECLMFWYYMEGSGVGELGVYLQTPDSHRDPTQLWTRTGDQGTHWRHGRVTLLSPDTPYQVIFEAIVGDGPRRDIAIDDLTILNGACPPTGFCDFEMDFCGWVNNPSPESGLDWDWLSAESEGTFIPRKDHTINSPLGHFALFMASYKRMSDREKVARLESESMEAVDQACLEIWHNSQAWVYNKPSDITLTVYVSDTAGLHPVWNTSGFANSTWIRDRVDYSSPGPHKIILEARCPASAEGSFALDDVRIMRNRSCEVIIPTATPTPTTTTTTAPASAMDCTFEKGLCNWIQEVNDDLNWTLSVGLEADQPWDGPRYDHTVGNDQGFFLLLNGSGSKDGKRAVVSVPVVNVPSEICVGFWYFMLGPSVSTLDLLVQTISSELLVWTRHGTQNPEWMTAQVTISRNDATRIMFAGHKNTNSQGFIAIDDITVKAGVCPSQTVCGFDSSSCGFENGVSHRGRWGRRKGTKDHVDHTYGTENGFYMNDLISNSTQPEEAQLLSPELRSDTEMCVRFWYWLTETSSNVLSIHVLRNGELGNALWQRHGAPSTGWEVAEVTVSSPANFHVVFEALRVPGSNSSVKIDDFSVRNGACSPPGSCDFESGQCTWVNVPREGGHDWVLANGGSQGPPTDHTTHTPDGWFLLSSSPRRNHSSVAQVASEWIQLTDTSSCLKFWYHMDDSDSGTLRVFVSSGPFEKDLIFRSNNSGSIWSSVSQSVETSKPFQLLIEAETNGGGFIAIDDISLTAGSCQVNETSSFAGCSFENGTCAWEEISVGQFQWVRGRNATGNTGPSVDNTLGTELGWYMAVDTDRGDQMSPAALQSPTMTQASATCTLHFYYNVYGEDAEELSVLLKEGYRTTTLWWLSGNHGDAWQHGEVTVGRIPQDFTILFEASRSFNKPGHVAIDDVTFANCTLPAPQPWCPDGAFMCNNSACVDLSRVCDFSDDCGDWSDENNCGAVESCSFEQGLCSWADSDVDTPGGEWTHREGQEAWPNHGPPRDHTKNSAAGRYVIPGTHLTEEGQTSEILSKTLLPSLNCTVRFFYFSANDATGRLTARSRTRRSGRDDKELWLRETSQSFSWQRAQVTFSSSARSKLVFSYELGEGPRGLVALDDISFSGECSFDPNDSELPDTSSTSAPSTPSVPPTFPPTTPMNPCQDNEFFCWSSGGNVCVLAALQCDYHADCPQAEDEAGCGPCTFESDQCGWTDTSDGRSTWRRQKANNDTEPPADHTTGTGYYMTVKSRQGSTQSEAMLQSPPLAPSSPYCQILFHFHISAASAGSLRVLMQQAEGSEAILWSRSHNTVSHWTPEHLPLGRQQQPYKISFSSINRASTWDHIAAVDDISFVNCEKSYQPPALPSYGCSFENGPCGWVQGAEDELDWFSGSGPTESPNTGPAGDHTTGKGRYLYIESSLPSVKGNRAQLKSSLLPPAGEKGYCFTFWYHMFGATVGSLRMLLQTADHFKETLVWQKSGNQGDEWLLAQSHVAMKEVHRVILESTVGGEAGDIAIDDIAFANGPCPATDLCDFEEGSCDWQQQQTFDDTDWVRQSGASHKPNTGPDSDHTTNTPTGHYYSLPSSAVDQAGETASMFSPLYPAGRGSCVQLWYHMYGTGMGTLNVYQQSEEGKEALIFSQSGDQGRLWRFAQAALLPRVQPYRIVVEGVKAGPTREGDMAFDDVRLTDAQCSPRGFCDFESTMCSWSNLGGDVDQGDWLRGSGASPNPNTGPSIDHTTNSTHGHYVYVDSSVGEWGDTSFLISDVFQPSTRGHCISFWYHMYGDRVGTLRLYINDRKIHAGGNEEGLMKWIKTGNNGDQWQEARVSITHEEAFWFVFAYQRGKNTGGDVALDDIAVVPSSCFSDPTVEPSDNNSVLYVGLAVGLTLLVGLIISFFLFTLNWKRGLGPRSTLTFPSTTEMRIRHHVQRVPPSPRLMLNPEVFPLFLNYNNSN